MDRNDLIYWLTKANDAKIVGADANGLHLSDTALDELFRKSFLKKRNTGERRSICAVWWRLATYAERTVFIAG